VERKRRETQATLPDWLSYPNECQALSRLFDGIITASVKEAASGLVMSTAVAKRAGTMHVSNVILVDVK